MTIDDFTGQTLEMENDYEGRVIATLIRSPKNTEGRISVLYFHGYNDYFFHQHVAEALHSRDYNFYALDLRKYGRSLLPHQHANYCRSMSEYFEEINTSLEIIAKENGGRKIIFLGHSTGGLLAALYMNEGKYKTQIDKLVLNSPFLEFNASVLERTLMIVFSRIISFFFPYASKNKPLSHLYSHSLLKSGKGEWEFREEWKPRRGFPAYLKWVIAVFEAQSALRSASDIKIPVLVMHSSASSRYRKWHDDISKTDMVLNIEHMKEHGQKLGPDVTFLEVENAIHDIFLSSEKVRKKALNGMLNWLDD